MIQEFIKELNNRKNLTGCIGTPNSSSGCYRLPTEAEWELATRAGSESAYYFGKSPDLMAEHAWYSNNSNYQTQAVGLKTPNANGLYDVYGNVWEWVQDKYTQELLGGLDPLQTAPRYHYVFRGGNWSFVAEYLRSALRYYDYSDLRSSVVGFRLVRTL